VSASAACWRRNSVSCFESTPLAWVASAAPASGAGGASLGELLLHDPHPGAWGSRSLPSESVRLRKRSDRAEMVFSLVESFRVCLSSAACRACSVARVLAVSADSVWAASDLMSAIAAV